LNKLFHWMNYVQYLCIPTPVRPTRHFGSSGSSGILFSHIPLTVCLFLLLCLRTLPYTMKALISRFSNTILGSWWSFGYWDTLLNMMSLYSMNRIPFQDLRKNQLAYSYSLKMLNQHFLKFCLKLPGTFIGAFLTGLKRGQNWSNLWISGIFGSYQTLTWPF